MGFAGPLRLQLQQVQDLIPVGQQPAEGVRQREGHSLTSPVVELCAVGVGGLLQVVQGPEPELHGRCQRAGPGPRTSRGDPSHFGDPARKLGQEQLVGHRDGELPALDGFRPLVGRLQLGVHPLLPQEPRAVLGDPVAPHQAHRLAHHVGAVAGVPELAGRAEDAPQGILDEVPDQRILLKRLEPLRVARRLGLGREGEELQRVLLHPPQRPNLGRAAFDPLSGEDRRPSAAPAGPVRRRAVPPQTPARMRLRPWPRHPPADGGRPPVAASPARSGASPGRRSPRPGSGPAGSG